jgi:hypothetical protein
MIHFLRHIRKSLLIENKFTKYLLYAIGEIILVVIGILIALQINNSNEQRKNEVIALQLLKQVQTDLVKNIEEADEMIEFFRIKDSLIYRVINDQVTSEDYKNYEFSRLILHVKTYDIEDNAFNTLVDRTHILPDYFNPIIDSLKILFHKKDLIYLNNENLGLFLSQFKSFLSQNFDGYTDFQYKFEKPSEELIDYFLNNPKYKNQVTEYAILSNRNLLKNTKEFRALSIESYFSISRILKTDLDKIRDSVSFLNDIDEFKSIVGTYTSKTGNIFMPVGTQIIISIEDNKIWFEWKKEHFKVRLYPLGDSKFMINEDWSFFKFRKDNMGKVLGFEYRSDNSIYEFDKNQ